MTCRHRKDGITLIELLLVMGVLALVLGFALPTWHAVMVNVTIDRELARLTAAIQLAQTNAIRELRPWRVKLDTDGGGFSLEYKNSTSSDGSSCDASGWSMASSYRLASDVRLSTTTASRPCLPFGPVGRPIWPSPVIDPNLGTNPRDLGKLPYLLDGNVLRTWTSSIIDPTHTDAPLVLFPYRTTITTSVLVFDLKELRYLKSPCLGLYSNPPKTRTAPVSYVYPVSIQVEVSVDDQYSDSTTWSVNKTTSVTPSVPGGPKEVKCLPLTINAPGRWVRLTISSDTGFGNPRVVLHEFDITPIYLELNETRTNQLVRRIRIDSSTGRITIG